MIDMVLMRIWDEIEAELSYQRGKYGDKCVESRSTRDALVPLVAEVGEVADAVCEYYDGRASHTMQIRRELVSVAACAVAMIRHIDRRQP